MLQHNPELKSQIDQLWNKFWAGRISNSLCTGIKSMCFFRLLIDKGLEVLFLVSFGTVCKYLTLKGTI